MFTCASQQVHSHPQDPPSEWQSNHLLSCLLVCTRSVVTFLRLRLWLRMRNRRQTETWEKLCSRMKTARWLSVKMMQKVDCMTMRKVMMNTGKTLKEPMKTGVMVMTATTEKTPAIRLSRKPIWSRLESLRSWPPMVMPVVLHSGSLHCLQGLPTPFTSPCPSVARFPFLGG